MSAVLLGERSELRLGSAAEVIATLPARSVWGVVTDPPFSPLEFREADLAAMRAGPSGGVWRQPPAIGGSKRRAVPRFTVLSPDELAALRVETEAWARPLLPVLRPGAHVFVASHPLTIDVVIRTFRGCGYEHRAIVIREVQTLRGGDRPKGAEAEFPEVSTMPRSTYEPWALFRAPLSKGSTVAENLRVWGTGALRRPSPEVPFGDVIRSAVCRGAERRASEHPAMKPQAFLRSLVRAVVPVPRLDATILDPFAGSASTLAAAAYHGIASVGIERDPVYFAAAPATFSQLVTL